MLTPFRIAAGASTQVQFNDAGILGGDAGLTYAKATDALSITGAADGVRLVLQQHSSGTSDLFQVKNSSGTVKVAIDDAYKMAIGRTNTSMDGATEYGIAVEVTSGGGGAFIHNATPSASSGAGMAGYLYDYPTASGHRMGYYVFGTLGAGTVLGNSIILHGYASEAHSATARGAYLVIETATQGTTTRAERMRVDALGNVIINNAAIATSATNGFLYIPSCAGAPSGTPTTYTGRIPIVYDSTNNRLYAYNGAWRSVALA